MRYASYPQIRTTKGKARLTWNRGQRHRHYSSREAAGHVLRKLKAGGPYHSADEIEAALIAIGAA